MDRASSSRQQKPPNLYSDGVQRQRLLIVVCILHQMHHHIPLVMYWLLMVHNGWLVATHHSLIYKANCKPHSLVLDHNVTKISRELGHEMAWLLPTISSDSVSKSLVCRLPLLNFYPMVVIIYYISVLILPLWIRSLMMQLQKTCYLLLLFSPLACSTFCF